MLKPDDNDEIELIGGTTDPRMVDEGEGTVEAQASIARPDVDVDVLVLQGGDSNPVKEYKHGSSCGGSQVKKNDDVLFLSLHMIKTLIIVYLYCYSYFNVTFITICVADNTREYAWQPIQDQQGDEVEEGGGAGQE